MSLQRVVRAHLQEGRGSLLGGQGRSTRWWELTLECGCWIERPVRHTAKRHGVAAGGRGWGLRDRRDVLPAPERAHCQRPADHKSGRSRA